MTIKREYNDASTMKEIFEGAKLVNFLFGTFLPITLTEQMETSTFGASPNNPPIPTSLTEGTELTPFCMYRRKDSLLFFFKIFPGEPSENVIGMSLTAMSEHPDTYSIVSTLAGVCDAVDISDLLFYLIRKTNQKNALIDTFNHDIAIQTATVVREVNQERFEQEYHAFYADTEDYGIF